jgi:hypothetical protein
MGQILVFGPGKGPARQALAFGMETDAKKRTRREQLRVYWSEAEMQNGNSG